MTTKQIQNVQDERIYYSATTFRKLLDSLARPGKITTLDFPHFLGELPDAPLFHPSEESSPSLNMYALGALMTLLDKEVTFAFAAHQIWLQPDSSVVQWIVLRSGARLAPLASPDTATFALLSDSVSGVLLSQLNEGTLLEPEASTTAFCCVERLADATETIGQDESVEAWLQLSLSGPGIDGRKSIYVSQQSASLINSIRATRQRYPLGIDVYLVDAMGRCVGLPRTTHIQQ